MNYVRVLEKYSSDTKIPLDTLLSMYLVIGDDLFFILEGFQGLNVKFPKFANYRKDFEDNVEYTKLSNSRYRVGNVWKKPKDIVVGDFVQIKDTQVLVESPVREVLGEYYLVVRRK